MKKTQSNRVIGVIPARYGSSRFPGKPLEKILGVSLIQRTYENAKKCSRLDDLIVATDDKRILDHVLAFGGHAVMTSENCLNGTDRIAEVLRENSEYHSAEIIINIQGDEPCLDPNVVTQVIQILDEDPEAVMSTAVIKLTSKADAENSSVVKCVMDEKHNALYFSRALIPGAKKTGYKNDIIYYKHLGIYGYRRKFLLQYASLEPTPLQLAEDLEQLKVLEHGYRIKTAIVESESIGVDLPEDIKKVEQFLCKPNTYL